MIKMKKQKWKEYLTAWQKDGKKKAMENSIILEDEKKPTLEWMCNTKDLHGLHFEQVCGKSLVSG